MALSSIESNQEPLSGNTSKRRQSPEEWKNRFLGALGAERTPTELGEGLEAGIKGRAWAQLKDPSGRQFRSFDDFCSAPVPYGLGTEAEIARELVAKLLGKRRAQLLTVAPSHQGARSGRLPAPGGEKSTRNDQRLRAIGERAPEVVQDLYSTGLLCAKDAERFGRKEKSEDLQVAIDDFCQRHIGTAKLTETASESDKDVLRTSLASEARAIFEQEPRLVPVYSAMQGDNGDLFPEVLKLHVPENSKVADVTFGRGAFWQNIPESSYQLLKSDIAEDQVDCRTLPYDTGSLDAVVLDPPYMEQPANTGLGRGLEESYHTSERDTHGHEEVIQLYLGAAREAARVLRANGVLIVKCQDEVVSGRNRWSHVEILQGCEPLGFECIDLFVLMQKGRPPLNSTVKQQKHARKNHSYFLVFRRRTKIRQTSSKAPAAAAPARRGK